MQKSVVRAKTTIRDIGTPEKSYARTRHPNSTKFLRTDGASRSFLPDIVFRQTTLHVITARHGYPKTLAMNHSDAITKHLSNTNPLPSPSLVARVSKGSRGMWRLLTKPRERRNQSSEGNQVESIDDEIRSKCQWTTMYTCDIGHLSACQATRYAYDSKSLTTFDISHCTLLEQLFLGRFKQCCS